MLKKIERYEKTLKKIIICGKENFNESKENSNSKLNNNLN